MKYRSTALFLSAVLTCLSLAQKPPLTHDVYDSWQNVSGNTLSRDGHWLMYAVNPQQGDNKVFVKSTSGKTVYNFERGRSQQFSYDGKFVISTIIPEFEKARDATRNKVKPADRPKNNLLILNLDTGEKTELERITSFTLPRKDSGWFVYRPEPPKKEDEKKEDKPDGALDQEEQEEKQDEEPKKKKGHGEGYTIIARNFKTGEEVKFENVSSYTIPEMGQNLIFARSPKGVEGHGVFSYNFEAGEETALLEGLGKYVRITPDREGMYVAILTDKDDYDSEKPAHSLYLYSASSGKTKRIAETGIADGWWIPSGSTLRWNKASTHLTIGLQPKPVEESEEKKEFDDEKVSVDVWSWTDLQLQPQQLRSANSEKNRQYDALYDVKSEKLVQIENEKHKTVTVPSEGTPRFGLSTISRAYGAGSTPDDFYLIDLTTGKEKLIAENWSGSMSFSPSGRWLFGFDSITKQSFVIKTKSGEKTYLDDRFPHPIYNTEADTPFGGSPYGLLGFTEGENTIYVYDKYDLYALDLTSDKPAESVTNGFGRRRGIRLRFSGFRKPDQVYFDPNSVAIFSGLQERTKRAGFYRDRLSGNDYPEELFTADERLGFAVKAENSDEVVLTRESFTMGREVFLTDTRFSEMRKMSNASTQKDAFNWGTVELVEWTSLDGDDLQGLVYKPEDFEYGKKYPMLVYFYEKWSDNYHRYLSPAPSASTINIPYFVSNGYVVFVPDIPYKEGYPGESAMSAIVSGVNRVLNDGYVDKDRMGIQGQSWGGYQVAYLVTETNMFAAAGAGAPVSNMFSAYGGIRWGSGLVRQLQYEQGQSRIGGTMWEYPMRYWENSPIFFVDKVETPLLIMHNDRDGAVPWWQGIEMFTALHRLQKPAWLLVYNGEDHNLVQRKNRKDLSIRLQQFFDHYLKDAPMPVWMAEGVPAYKKGTTYGFELTDGGK